MSNSGGANDTPDILEEQDEKLDQLNEELEDLNREVHESLDDIWHYLDWKWVVARHPIASCLGAALLGFTLARPQGLLRRLLDGAVKLAGPPAMGLAQDLLAMKIRQMLEGAEPKEESTS